MAFTAPLTDAVTPLDIENTNIWDQRAMEPGNQRASQSRNSESYAILSAFVLGTMVATIGLLTVQHYGLGDASFPKFFFVSTVPRVQPVSGANGASVGVQVSMNRGNHVGRTSPVSFHQSIPTIPSQQMSLSSPDMGIPNPLTTSIDDEGTMKQQPSRTDGLDDYGTGGSRAAMSYPAGQRSSVLPRVFQRRPIIAMSVGDVPMQDKKQEVPAGGRVLGALASIASTFSFGGLIYLFRSRQHRKASTNARATLANDHEAVVHDKNMPAPYRSRIRRLLGLLAPDWRLLSIAFIFLVAAAAAQGTGPYFLSQTLKAIIDGQAAGTLSRSTFVGPISKLVLAATVGAIASALRGACFIAVGARSSERLRSQLFKSLLRQDMGFFDNIKTGEVTSRLTQDCQRVADQVSFNANFFTRSVVELITTLCFMLYYSATLTMISFATVPVLVFLSKIMGDYMTKLSKETQERLADANAVADEAISSIATVRTFAGERIEEGRFGHHMQEYVALEIRRAKIYVAYLSATMLLPQLGNVLVLFQIGVLCMNGFPAATLLAFVFYLQTLNRSFNSIADVYTSIMQALGSSERVFELIDRVPDGRLRVSAENVHESTEVPTPEVAGRLQLINVHFNYPSRRERPALQGLNLECPAGSCLALVGPSGGGKSTCISLFQRLYEPHQGLVLLDGREVGEYNSHAYNAIVTTVSQEPVLFGCTVRENILYGLPENHSARSQKSGALTVESAARLANAHDFISAMPQGYDTEVGERGVQLSGGQKQRIAIARALIRRPKVLLLDEATSALDAESEMLVQKAVNNLIAQQDLTVVIVAHRLSTVKQADRICVVQDGQIVEEGVHGDLLQVPNGLYRRLVQNQLQDPLGATI